MRVVPTYVILGCVVLVLAFVISRVKFPDHLDTNPNAGPSDPIDQGSFGALLKYPHLFLAVVAEFGCIGAQIGTWSTYIPYLKAYTSVTERQAGYLLTAHLIAFGLGRICSTPVMRYIAPGKMAGTYALINIGLMFVCITHPGMTSGYLMILTSFFMSIMYPTIFALGVKGLGANTKLGGSLIVMSIVSGAIFPPLMGVVARSTGDLAAGYWLPVGGFVVVALYGLLGGRMTGKPTVHDVDMAPTL